MYVLMGVQGFDPLGVGSWDICNWNFLREAEIKHGRVAMLGFAGVLVESLGIKAPGVAATFGMHAKKKNSRADDSSAGLLLH